MVKKNLNYIKLYNELFILYGQNLTLKSHANHGIKLILCAEEVTVVHDRRLYKSKGLILKSDLTLWIKPNHHIGISIFIDPETEIGQVIGVLFKTNKIIKIDGALTATLFEFFHNVIENHATEADIKKYLQHVFGQSITSYRKLDTRIELVISHIIQAQSTPVQFNALLELSSLSASRLIHLFKKEVGIPMRRYILWCKMKRALAAIASGANIKKAASIAGFTDAAHFNRTFLSMFGNSPSNLLK